MTDANMEKHPVQHVFKITTDDWYPSYKLDSWYEGSEKNLLVEVGFLHLRLKGNHPNVVKYREEHANDPAFRVAVWGGDDMGLERDFHDEESAWNCYLQVIAMLIVNQEPLKALGFVQA